MTGSVEAFERMARLLAQLYTRPGHPFERDDPEVHRLHFLWLLKSGQWGMLASEGKLLGWQGWYCTDDAGLARLRDPDHAELIRGSVMVPLTAGPHVHIAATVTAPWAPGHVYRGLFNLTIQVNPTAASFSAHLRKRDGRIRWMFRSGARAKQCQSERARAAAAASR